MSELGFSDEEIEIIERLRAQAMTEAAKPLDALRELANKWRLKAAPNISRGRNTTPVTLTLRRCADELEETLAAHAEAARGSVVDDRESRSADSGSERVATHPPSSNAEAAPPQYKWWCCKADYPNHEPNANTGASTINVNGLGVKNITKNCPTATLTLEECAEDLEQALAAHAEPAPCKMCELRNKQDEALRKWNEGNHQQAETAPAPGLREAKDRVAIVERVMKLPYIKATRNASVGEERFVARDDVITAIHEYAKEARAALKGASL